MSGERMSVEFERSLSVTNSGWYHLRAEGDRGERFPLDASCAQAFTNPTWIEVGGKPVGSREASEYSLRWIDKLQEMAEEWPGWRSQKEKTMSTRSSKRRVNSTASLLAKRPLPTTTSHRDRGEKVGWEPHRRAAPRNERVA